MGKILELFRVREWYDSKIPSAMAVFLYCYLDLENKIDNSSFLAKYIAVFLFFFTYLANNYLINDYFDMEIDRKAGKIKRIHSMKKETVLGMITILFLIGNGAVMYAEHFSLKTAGMCFLIYLLGASYSMKYIRMKERGIWGVIVSSFAQRNTPMLLIMMMLPVKWDVFVLWMLIAFINGTRYILIHQYKDMENDKKSNVRTFVGDNPKVCKGAINLSLLIETAALFWLFKEEFLQNPFLWGLLIVYLFTMYMNYLFVERVLHDSFMYSFANVPLEDLYNVYLPLMLTFSVVYETKLYLLLLLTILYLLWPFFKKIYMPFMAVRKKLDHSL